MRYMLLCFFACSVELPDTSVCLDECALSINVCKSQYESCMDECEIVSDTRCQIECAKENLECIRDVFLCAAACVDEAEKSIS